MRLGFGKFLQILVLMLFFTAVAGAQESRMQRVSLYLCGGFVNEKLPGNIKYVPFPVIGKYEISISKKTKKNHVFFFHAEPQINPVLIIPEKKSSLDENPVIKKSTSLQWETGVNFGFSYRYFVNGFEVMAGFGSGPHFITLTTTQQHGGFIFSDNFFVEISRTIGKYSVNIQTRFRHLSNAGIKNPNNGIDNFLLLAGFSKKLF